MDWKAFVRDPPKFFELDKLVDTGTARLEYYLCIGPKVSEFYFEQTESSFIDGEWTRVIRRPLGGRTQRFLKGVRRASKLETTGLYKDTVEIELEINDFNSTRLRIPSDWIVEIQRHFPLPRPTR